MSCNPVLNCEPLRAAVFRNRTPDRAIRHSVARTCIPVAMLPVVSSWLQPWHLISEASALEGLRSLEIMQCLKADSGLLGAQLTSAMESAVPAWSNVTSLNMRADVTPAQLASIIMCLPALRSLAAPAAQLLSDDLRYPCHPLGPEQVPWQVLPKTPQLTSLDLRDASGRSVPSAKLRDLLLRSLLCSRLTLRTLVAQHTAVLDAVELEFGRSTPRLLTEQPMGASFLAHPEDAATRRKAAIAGRQGKVLTSLFTFQSPAWTLQRVTIEAGLAIVAPETVWSFVLACPVLQFLKLAWRPVYPSWHSACRPLSSVPTQWNRDDPPVAAHAAVLSVAQAFEDRRGALRSLQGTPHAVALGAMVEDQEYPAALLCVLARGLQLTTLRKVVLSAVPQDQHVTIDAVVEAVRLLQQAARRAARNSISVPDSS